VHRIFAGMAVWASILMAGEVALGIATKRASPGWVGLHLALGVLLGIYLSLLHVMVMFHFIGSGKEMKQAMEVLGEDADLVLRLKKLKMVVSPLATFAPILFGAGVIVGGGAHMNTLGSWAWIHWAIGGAGIALNLYAFPVEYRALVTNLEILREVDERLKREIAPGLFHE
jgi:hypothetical protein